jgi:aquaporin Z
MAHAEADGTLSHLDHELVASLNDFHDPNQEWRRLFSELLGTFFLVLVAAGGGMMGQAFPNTISRAAAVAAPGMMVMAIILFMGKVSGAHLNPAVSIAFSLRGDFPWRRVPGYIVAQLIGATLAALFLHAVINVSASYGSNYPASGYSASDAFMMEAVLTLGLVSVILGTASGAQTEVLNSKSAPQALVEQGSSFSGAGTAFTAAPGNREPRSNRALFVSRGRSRRTCF